MWHKNLWTYSSHCIVPAHNGSHSNIQTSQVRMLLDTSACESVSNAYCTWIVCTVHHPAYIGAALFYNMLKFFDAGDCLKCECVWTDMWAVWHHRGNPPVQWRYNYCQPHEHDWGGCIRQQLPCEPSRPVPTWPEESVWWVRNVKVMWQIICLVRGHKNNCLSCQGSCDELFVLWGVMWLIICPVRGPVTNHLSCVRSHVTSHLSSEESCD